MVECNTDLDLIFASLADSTRRNILSRVLRKPQSIGQLCKVNRDISFAAIAKHIVVLEKADLIKKERKGKYQIISPNPLAIEEASKVLHQYKAVWEERFNALDELLK